MLNTNETSQENIEKKNTYEKLLKNNRGER